MKAVVLHAQWQPRDSYRPTPKDVPGRLTYLGSRVWRHPAVEVTDKPVPRPAPTQVLLRVRACGICGSDVHMAQADSDGYTLYPGLTAFPVVLGHEFSGEVVEAGPQAINRRTGARFEPGEPVCVEEMLWCGYCRPCADGFPNHCENLQELGFTVDGAFAEYVAVDARYCWSLKELQAVYPRQDVFLVGSLMEPTSVSYNAIFERAGGIRPGDLAVVIGGGPIGLTAVALLKKAGAARVILSEPSPVRAEVGRRLGADAVVDPTREDLAERVLALTDGWGAELFVEAAGLAHLVMPQIERILWEGRAINAKVVLIGRADVQAPLTGEVFQVRRAQLFGAQGHSGHGNFPRAIRLAASGMDLRPLITRRVRLEEVPDSIRQLQGNRTEAKVTAVLD